MNVTVGLVAAKIDVLYILAGAGVGGLFLYLRHLIKVEN
jgi:hypothetical protein